MMQAVKMALAPPVWRAVSRSWRLTTPLSTELSDGPAIFACLHRDILPAICFVEPVRPCLLVSNSPDGEILIRTLRRGNYVFARGSTGSGGGRALVLLRRELEAGVSVGLAVDGPKGPFGKVQEGILHLARLTGAPIIPLRATARRAWTLRTWDRTLVPMPFARVDIETAPGIVCPRRATTAQMEALKSGLERFFTGEATSP